MAETFIGVEIAVVVVTASIVLSGILIGLGRAFSYKKIEQFGMEELVQSVINAAIIGSFAAIIELVGVISTALVTATCSQGNVITQLSCTFTTLNFSLFTLFQELIKLIDMLGYYQSISLDFGALAISPFVNLASISDILASQLFALNVIMILVEINHQIALFIAQNALGLIFPVGLVLRSFFATRRVGGFLLAVSLGLFVFYPTFVLIFPNPADEISNSTLIMTNFTNNSYYATIPVIDLNDNYALAGKLDVLSGRCDPANFNFSIYNITNLSNITGPINMTNMSNCEKFIINEYNISPNRTVTADFSGDLTVLAQNTRNSLSKSTLYAVIAPIFSLIITIVFVREVSSILGGEIGFQTFTSI